MDNRTGGRRAVVAGTGLEVWEIIAAWKSLDRDLARLRSAYDWLSEPQLRSALAYYSAYPDETDERLTRETAWTPERARRELPFTIRGA